MSRHRSFNQGGGSGKKKTVLQRFDRIKLLKERGQWSEGISVMGLRKTKPAE